MSDVLDARARLLRVQVVVPYNHGAGVTPVKLFEQSSHGSRREATELIWF